MQEHRNQERCGKLSSGLARMSRGQLGDYAIKRLYHKGPKQNLIVRAGQVFEVTESKSFTK